MPGGGGGEVNYVHAEVIWRQRLEEETKAAEEWHGNWGFLANKPQPPPRGFSTRTSKYTYGGTQWTLHQTRVPDSSEQGVAAAVAERDARKRMQALAWTTKLPTITKPCEAKGAYTGIPLVESDTSGVKTREQALLMRTHMFQSLGDSCRTAGVDPAAKYRAPVTAAHEVGWQVGRARSAGTRPTLEMFGVSEHGIKGMVARFN